MNFKILIVFLLCFHGITTTGQSNASSKVKSALEGLQKDYSPKNQRTYLESFPNSFESFNKVFGFQDGEPAPLYDGFQYVQVFFHLSDIPEKQRIQKCINISIGGYWEADAVNYFQNNLRPKILNNVDLTYELLIERTNTEIESFFYFFFNEIHPKYETVPTELKKLQSKDKEFYKLILSGHERAIKESGH